MTEKRFKFAHDNVGLNLKTPIVDGDKKMSLGGVLNEMNALHEEKEFCKILIGLANALIDDLGSETLIKHWEGIRDEKYEEWRKLE